MQYSVALLPKCSRLCAMSEVRLLKVRWQRSHSNMRSAVCESTCMRSCRCLHDECACVMRSSSYVAYRLKQNLHAYDAHAGSEYVSSTLHPLSVDCVGAVVNWACANGNPIVTLYCFLDISRLCTVNACNSRVEVVTVQRIVFVSGTSIVSCTCD